MKKNNIGLSSAVMTKNQDFVQNFHIKCEDGEGHMDVYHVFDGISVIFNHFQCVHAPEGECRTHFLEINHCLHGKYEATFEGGKYGYIKEGDLAVSERNVFKRISGFPLGYYTGLEVLIDVETAKKILF